jgi:hypothetical protein
MIKVNFTNGTSKRYNVTCKDLLCSSWHGVDYKWAFNEIAKLIDVDANSIDSWRVA